MSEGDHSISSKDRQRTAADPISTEVRRHEELGEMKSNGEIQTAFYSLHVLAHQLIDRGEVEPGYNTTSTS